MSKEVKLGLAMVGALGLTLAAVLTMRLRAKDAPAAAEADQARQALAAMKEEKSRMDAEAEKKPSLFAMNEPSTPAGEPAATTPSAGDNTATSNAANPDPFNRYGNSTPPAATATAEPNSLVGDRYASAATEPPTTREERREQKELEREAAKMEAPTAQQPPMQANDPFQQAAPDGLAAAPGSPDAGAQPPPQATLADGIAPAAIGNETAPASPYGLPAEMPGAAPLTRSAGDVRLESPETAGQHAHADQHHPHHHQAPPTETLQTAGEAPADSRYPDYRAPRSDNPLRGKELAREREIMKEMRREDDHYGRPQQPPAAAATPQYDIYGRDLKAEREDPPAAPTAQPPNVVTGPVGEDPLGRRSENIAADGTDAAPVDGRYRVAPGDNFWTISQKVYGSGSYFKALEEHNRERYPYSDKLPVGHEVHVPPARELEEKYPDLVPRARRSKDDAGAFSTVSTEAGGRGRVYKVQEGDTLFDIARDQLGKASRWNEIYELNRAQLGADFDFLTPGMELMLPENRPASRDPLTTQARERRNR